MLDISPKNSKKQLVTNHIQLWLENKNFIDTNPKFVFVVSNDNCKLTSQVNINY